MGPGCMGSRVGEGRAGLSLKYADRPSSPENQRALTPSRKIFLTLSLFSDASLSFSFHPRQSRAYTLYRGRGARNCLRIRSLFLGPNFRFAPRSPDFPSAKRAVERTSLSSIEVLTIEISDALEKCFARYRILHTYVKSDFIT